MANVTNNRPLSPHLQIYKPIPTMVMSILHRITGGALYFGTLLVAWWLIAASTGAAYFEWVSWFMGTLIGRLILFGYTWALVHHMLGGLRHLMWDLGYGSRQAFLDQARQGHVRLFGGAYPGDLGDRLHRSRLR